MSYEYSWETTALGTLVRGPFRVVHRDEGAWRIYRLDIDGAAQFVVMLESEAAAKIYCEIELSNSSDSE